jgi:uncharacterized membrane protein
MAESLQPAAGGTSTGLAPNVAGALSYLFAPITGIIFYVLEKENAFVRFHAAQSIVFGVAMIVLSVINMVLGMVLGAVPVIGWLISILLSLAIGLGGFAAWLFLMFKAFGGTEYELPVAGAQARKLLQGGSSAA